MIANNQNIIYNNIIKIKRELVNVIMPEENEFERSIYSHNDPLDINELASLNDDISPEFIEQLQSQVSQDANKFTGRSSNQVSADGALFEEISAKNTEDKSLRIDIDNNIDDNFIKKYKAKLNKQQANTPEEKEILNISKPKVITNNEKIEKDNASATTGSNEIEELTNGSIIEKPVVQEQLSYNDSLDFLDDNIKYSKYVIYIDPENTDFIESLTVKERKNLINKILREQDDIALTKKRFNTVHNLLKHTIVGVITVAIAIPVLYCTVNASLEASINNYRRSKTIFQTLYKEKGKIKSNAINK